jgi:hypothetical protein
VILWIADAEALPTDPVTIGVWEADDITRRSYWRVFGARYRMNTYFDQHIAGWRHCLAFTTPGECQSVMYR